MKQLSIKNLKNIKGYTLIELLAASAIFSGMMIVSVATFSVASSQESAITSRRVVNRSARLAVETMIREMDVSRNTYDLVTKQINPGFGAYMIAYREQNVVYPPRFKGQADKTGEPVFDKAGVNQIPLGEIKLKPIHGNALIVFNFQNNTRVTRGFFLCPHPNDNNFYSLGVKNLDLSANANFALGDGWNAIKNQMTCAGWKQITSSDVIIEKPTDVYIEGFFPEQGLTVQPRLTIAVKARNRQGTRAEDTFYSVYRTTTTHRDYGVATP